MSHGGDRPRVGSFTSSEEKFPSWLVECHATVPSQLASACSKCGRSRDLQLIAMSEEVFLSLVTCKTELVVRGVYVAGKTQRCPDKIPQSRPSPPLCTNSSPGRRMMTHRLRFASRLRHRPAPAPASQLMRDIDCNTTIWNARLVLATTPAPPPFALSDVAILVPCREMRLSDPKQTSRGTGPGDRSL